MNKEGVTETQEVYDYWLTFHCPKCNIKFGTKEERNYHLGIHSPKWRKARYSCKDCATKRLVFNTCADWRRHKHVIHDGLQEIPCPRVDCNKQFSAKSQVRQHLLRCHHLTRYSCEYCQREFTSPSGRHQHVLTVHQPQLRPRCDDCDLSFLTPTRLRAHRVYLHAPRTNKCRQCQELFLNLASFKKHVCPLQKIRGDMPPRDRIAHLAETL
jgi:hypothetical protein